MSKQTEPMTEYGFNKISKELESLKGPQRLEVAKEIDEARELGDLKENAEYHSAKEKQAHMERRISELSDILTRAVVIDPSKMSHNRVSFGSTVYLLDVDTEEEYKYTIIGSAESNVEKGLISYHSPLVKSLLGKEVGDEVEVNFGKKKTIYEIEKICFEDICFE